jgi:hypothetical protein
MTQLVINLSRVTQQVGIIDAKSRRTSFRLMARGRVETNYEIDPNWLAHNPGVIKVVKIVPPVATTPATTETPTSTEKEAKATATVTSTAKKAVATETVATSIAPESTKAEGA